jgi:hypothetical protein
MPNIIIIVTNHSNFYSALFEFRSRLSAFKGCNCINYFIQNASYDQKIGWGTNSIVSAKGLGRTFFIPILATGRNASPTGDAVGRGCAGLHN